MSKIVAAVGRAGWSSITKTSETASPYTLDYLNLPDDEHLRAVGEISIRHGHMHHALRMTIKTILDMTPAKAMEATERARTSGLIDRVLKLAYKRIGDGAAYANIEALLERGRLANERRNGMVHGFWSQSGQGLRTMKDHPTNYGAEPTIPELHEIANELFAVALELNHARLKGFLAEALLPAKATLTAKARGIHWFRLAANRN